MVSFVYQGYATSVCTEIMLNALCRGILAGDYLSDLLFAVDRHGQLLAPPVFFSSKTEELNV
jgi:hypothetical protein